MNYSVFEGDYRRVPEQNLAGASKHVSREEFLRKTRQDRLDRQLAVKKNECATIIQAAVRGFLSRKTFRSTLLQLVKNATEADQEMEHPLPKLGIYIYMYKRLDILYYYEIMSFVSNQILEYHLSAVIEDFIEDDSIWLWRIKWLLKLHLKKILSGCINFNLKASLEILETFTSDEMINDTIDEDSTTLVLKEITLYMVNNRYFNTLFGLLIQKFFPYEFIFGLEREDEEDSPALIVLFKIIAELIRRAFSLMTEEDVEYRHTVMQEFSKVFLNNFTTRRIVTYIFPVLFNSGVLGMSSMVDLITSGKIPITSSCLYFLVDFFQKGYRTNFGKILEAFMFLLGARFVDHRIDADVSFCNYIFFEKKGDSDEEDEPDDTKYCGASKRNLSMIRECDAYLRSIKFANDVLNYIDGSCTLEILVNLAKLMHVLITRKCYENYKILWYASTHSILYKDLWSYITAMQRITPQGALVTLFSLVTKGALLVPAEANEFYPLLTTFCWVFKRYISMALNHDITHGPNFVPLETINDITVKLRDLGATLLHIGIPVMPFQLDEQTIVCNIDPMKDLYKVVIHLLRALHARAFGTDQSIFVTRNIYMPQTLSINFDIDFLTNHILYDEKTMFDITVIPYNSIIKPYAILRDLPFCLPIRDRIAILQEMFFTYKMGYQNPNDVYLVTPTIKIRRGYIYEDAFERLSITEVPEIRVGVRVQLISVVGHEEVGVDGGGIFREFMNEFLRSAFDPNRGFFLLNNDQQLYPNPHVHVLYPDFRKHYFFIGRMLAKALFENILIELPLAECFISSFMGREKDVNIYNLHSLDAELFKNLISLRNYDGDFSNLGLNYTLVTDLYGKTKVIELIEDGDKINVTKDNRLDYILQVAEHKLITQFQEQIIYLRKGFCSVVPVFWLGLFSPKELQTLIFHSDAPINVEDLRRSCCYAGGYTANHPNIIRFWRVVFSLNDAELKQLLKFVTTCSRQPLLGFKHLDPLFTIQKTDDIDFLPTSSTCTNLLQLPLFSDEEEMKTKLLYSIQSESGFDLC